jgi:hypothetical protein
MAATATAAGGNPNLLVPEPSTPIHSTNPFLDEFTVRSQWLKSIILNNIINPRALGLKTDGTPKELWDSLTNGYGKPTVVGHMNAEAQLAACKFANYMTDENPVNAYVKAKSVAWGNAVNQGVTDSLSAYLTLLVSGLTPEFIPIFGLVMLSGTQIEAENHIHNFKGVVDQV